MRILRRTHQQVGIPGDARFVSSGIGACQVAAGSDLQCGGESYHLIQSLGDGEISQVYLARRVGMLPFLATIKVSSAAGSPVRYAREAEVLRDLQAAQSGAASVYAAQRLPEVIAQGPVEGANSKQALVLRHPIG